MNPARTRIRGSSLRRLALAAAALLSLSSFGRPPAAAQESVHWTLADAVGYSLEHSPDLAVAASRIKETEEARAEVYSNFLPDLSFEGGYTYIDNVPRIAIDFPVDPPGDLIPPFQINRQALIGANDNYKAKFVLNQLLFASGKVYYAHRAASSRIDSERSRLEALRLQVARAAAEAYNAALIAQEAVEVQRQSLEAARAHLAQVKRKHEAGAATRLELLRAEVEASNREPRVTEAEKKLDLALARLRRAAGLPEGTPVSLADPIEAAPENVNEAEALERAIRMRPELAALSHLQQAAEDQALAQRGAMLPSVLLTGTFGYEKPYFALDEWERNWTVGVGVRVPLFDGLEAYHGMKKARAAAATARESASQAAADIQVEVRSALLELREATLRIPSTRSNMDRARDILAIAEESYRAGASTSLEVIDAQLAATTARLDHLKALYDYRVARVRLAAATGDLEAIGR